MGENPSFVQTTVDDLRYYLPSECNYYIGFCKKVGRVEGGRKIFQICAASMKVCPPKGMKTDRSCQIILIKPCLCSLEHSMYLIVQNNSQDVLIFRKILRLNTLSCQKH